MQVATSAGLAALFLAVTWCSWPGLAIASPTYPGAVAGALDLPCEPACTLCHTRATGGFGTVNTPFGRAARMGEGLECCSPGTLPDVLDALAVAETDSDGDGSPDIEEISALTDPNDAADVDLACASADDGDSGCAVVRARRASGRASTSAALVVALAAVVASRIARRRFA